MKTAQNIKKTVKQIRESLRWDKKATALLWATYGDTIVRCPECGGPSFDGYQHCGPKDKRPKEKR